MTRHSRFLERDGGADQDESGAYDQSTEPAVDFIVGERFISSWQFRTGRRTFLKVKRHWYESLPWGDSPPNPEIRLIRRSLCKWYSICSALVGPSPNSRPAEQVTAIPAAVKSHRRSFG